MAFTSFLVSPGILEHRKLISRLLQRGVIGASLVINKSKKRNLKKREVGVAVVPLALLAYCSITMNLKLLLEQQ
ncbi:hypothetical protein V1477_014022 [Vespula maculifrons]|uniref:Uncharacterized protein n=1 Tax=Vespula maculifrons TaxID=7453 RepID=A0ABD2BLD1_VESMC